MENIRSEKGLTLISIIMMIVAVLVIVMVANALVGENGLVTRALQAKRETQKAVSDENHMFDSILLGDEGIFQEQINYKDSLASIANPDRGLYTPVTLKLAGDSDNTTTSNNLKILRDAIINAKGKQISLIHLRMNIGLLSKGANTINDMDFTTNQLDHINAIFAELRQNKMKAIVRFAYDFDGNQDKEPSSFGKIEDHIKQLAKTFETNNDVISTIEAGLIGSKGEMLDGKYATDANYKKLIESYLKNTPNDMLINVRTLAQYRAKFGNIIPYKSSAATLEDQFRVGIFNDGYLGSSTDLGTFENREEFIKFMESLGTYTLYGGEVTKVNSPDGDESYSNIDKCSVEMPKTHTTYLNSEFNADILNNKWDTQKYTNASSEYNGQTALKYIQDHLGYRMVLRKSLVSRNVKQGDICKVNLLIENVGFAPVIHNQKVIAILKQVNGNKRYEAKTDIDIRGVESGKTVKVNFGLFIPNDIDTTGEWEIYLKVSDLRNANYSIQFANPDIYKQYSNADNANYLGKIKIEANSGAATTAFKQAFCPDAEAGKLIEE